MYDGDIRNHEDDDDESDLPAARQTVGGESRAEMIERMRRRIRNRLDAGPQRPCDFRK